MPSNKNIFIGSSSESLSLATILAEILVADGWAATPWNEHFDVYSAGRSNIDTLKLAVESNRIGIFFLTPDDKIEIRGRNPQQTVRTNVWFEIGMFVASYDSRNVLILADQRDLTNLANPTDYAGISFVTYDLNDSLKTVVRDAYEARETNPSFTLEAEPQKGIKSVLEDAYKKKFKRRLDEVAEDPTVSVKYLSDRKSCYDWGAELIQGAKQRLYSVISYEQELDDGSPGLLPKIVERIQADKIAGLKSPRLRRWMNLGDKEIADQARQILKEYPEIEVRDTYCKFIEAVVTDNKTLLVLPRPDKMTALVGSGILIESKPIADQFAMWFETRLPEQLDVKLSAQNLENYLNMEVRNTGPRMGNRNCFACSTPLNSLAQQCNETFQKVMAVDSKG
ncbi:MAG: TIR domain-containing protein [Pirellula sp.]